MIWVTYWVIKPGLRHELLGVWPFIIYMCWVFAASLVCYVLSTSINHCHVLLLLYRSLVGIPVATTNIDNSRVKTEAYFNIERIHVTPYLAYGHVKYPCTDVCACVCDFQFSGG